MESVRKIWDDVAGLWSLVVGLKVTGTYFVKHQVTVHYPRNEVDNLESFRGPIELIASPDDPEMPRCIACMTCMTVCPGGCISVTKQKRPKVDPVEPGTNEEGGDTDGRKKAPKRPSAFIYNYTLCCLCALCVENCPVHSLRFSNRAYLAGTDKTAFIFNLLEKFNDKCTVQDK